MNRKQIALFIVSLIAVAEAISLFLFSLTSGIASIGGPVLATFTLTGSFLFFFVPFLSLLTKRALPIGCMSIVVIGVLLALVIPAWMRVWVGFPLLPELRVLSHTWDPNNEFIALLVKSTAWVHSLSVSSVRVNDIVVAESNVVYAGSFTGDAHTLEGGDSGIIVITHAFVSNTKYEFVVQTNRYDICRYVAIAL